MKYFIFYFIHVYTTVTVK